jgi:hypothetical protein
MLPRGRRLPALLLVALLAAAAGCGGAQREAASVVSSTYELVLTREPPPPDPGAPLPAEMCFVAVRNHELALFVEEGGNPALCEQLAAYLPRGAGRAGWPVPVTGNEEEDTPTLECAVAGFGVRVEVLTWTRDSTALFGTDVCEEMIQDGWGLQPLHEFFNELPSGTCFVATARYEVALAGETQGGHEPCEEVARTHLPAPIVYRSLPAADADAMGETVCEASRRGDRMKVISMPVDRGSIDFDAVCDSLEKDGWKVVRWGG